jgi:putative ABC transport system ATP-binding protein
MLIRVEDLTKRYWMGGTEVQALSGVSLTVERGEYLAVMGASGSGKSTLMHLIGCLDRPTTGRYWLDGTPVEGLTDEQLSALRNRKISFVFQSFNLIPQLSVIENVAVPLIYRGIERSEREAMADRVLASVGLAPRRGHRPNELSGGECQRVAIARALVTQPDIILADEPTGNLDSRTGDEVMEILTRLNEEGTTVLMVTHDVFRAQCARRVIQMQDGKITNQLVGAEIGRMLRQFEAVTRIGAAAHPA